jgi:diguanylate cyclase (GGDEF)-like protein
VARRLFLLFILSALLPLATIAILSLVQGRSMMLEQGDQRISAAAKSYGMDLFERLLLAADLTLTVSTKGPGNDAVTRILRSVTIVDAGGKARQVMGDLQPPPLQAAARSRLEDGKPVLVIAGEAAHPMILVAARLPRSGGAYAIGEVAPTFLWGPMDEAPAATELCVAQETSRRILHCHAAGGEGALRQFATTAVPDAAAVTWERDGETYRGRAWGQFMRAGLGTEDWLVLASQPEQLHLAPLEKFRRLYIPVVLLALLLVTWFTIRQSRSIVEPVALLAERARGIGRNEFDARLGLVRDDEFGELAAAFDQMTERLGRQFASLNALAEIDGLILSAQDTTQVIRTVLQRLGNAVAADFVTLTLFERESRATARTYYMAPGPGEGFQVSQKRVTPEQIGALESDAASRWVALGGAGPVPFFLEQASAQGMAHAFFEPIAWRGSVCGAIVLGYLPGSDTSDEEKRRARELADRVAVAVASAWRDEQLYLQAHFDVLTGAPNRLLFKDRLGVEIVRSQRQESGFALLYIDLDRFKGINDSLGHSVGDLVLCEAAARIALCIRASDSMSRLGGDEFTVMLTDLDHVRDARPIAEAIVAALSREFVVAGNHCFLSASVGIASYPADGDTVEALLKSADTAMYRAKAGGRAQVVFFEERMNAEAVARLNLDRDLRKAIERGELAMHYQPKVDLRTGEIRSAEALVRWYHPTRGLISPVLFIPLAEETGLIEELGLWTMQQSCRQVNRWREQGIALDHVAVNVSPAQFRRQTLVDTIAACVAAAGLQPSCLEIEITEGLLLDQGPAVEGALRALSAAGHRIALDDFGTGFSSMSYLKRFPVDTVKIDRTFVDGLEDGADSEAIVSAIIAMSHALGKKVVAEGVETEGQAEILRRLRCDQIQGFLIAPAIPPDEFVEFVRLRSSSLVLA